MEYLVDEFGNFKKTWHKFQEELEEIIKLLQIALKNKMFYPAMPYTTAIIKKTDQFIFRTPLNYRNKNTLKSTKTNR